MEKSWNFVSPEKWEPWHRDAVSSGLLFRGHLISPSGHLVLHYTGQDWPPKVKSYFADILFTEAKE